VSNETLTLEEMKNLFRRIEKLETAVDHLSSVTNNVVQSQSMFEYKHEQAGLVSQKLENLVERISERGDEQLQHTIRMLDEREQNITRHISHYRDLLEIEMLRKHENVTGQLPPINTAIATVQATLKEHEEKIGGMQKIIWTASGITVASVTIIEYALSLVR